MRFISRWVNCCSGVVLFVAIVASLHIEASQQPATAQTKEIEVYSDSVVEGPQPATLADKMSKVDAVALVHVDIVDVATRPKPSAPGASQSGAGLMANVPEVLTLSTVTVKEVYKASGFLPRAGATTVIAQPVG